MAPTDNYILQLLYGLADDQPYRTTRSFVLQSNTFKSSFPTSDKPEFVPVVIPQYKKK